MMENSLLSRAFEVEEISSDFDPSIPPSTGHEYLQHVMYEASRCPQVVVANIDEKKIKKTLNLSLDDSVNDNSKPENALAPTSEWQQQQLAIFSGLRRRVEKCKRSKKFKPIPLPKYQNEEKWLNICFGDEKSRLEPSLTLLLSMSDSMLSQMVEYQTEWLEEDLKPNQGKWIYSVLACLNLPLIPPTCSTLRDLVRKCVKLRASKVSKEDNDVNVYNLIICLITKYFGQTDLGD